jgi:probable F420-dependent oxidoreductase
MKLGVLFPQVQIGSDPVVIRDFAQAVEQLGFEHLVTYEHVLGADPEGREAPWVGPYTHAHQFHEPFVLFGYLAGFTQTLRLGTAVLNLPQRQTVLVAKQAAEVDVLSRGRMRLGVGLGWNTIESDAMGADFESRGQRAEEQIAVLRALWTQPLVTFEGRWHRISRAGLNPMPIQRPIPIWMAGESDLAVERVGRLADGWYPGAGWISAYRRHETADEAWPRKFELMRAAARSAGRDPASIQINGWLSLSRDQQPNTLRQEAEEWLAQGATHLTINSMRGGFETPGEHLEAIGRAREALSGLT